MSSSSRGKTIYVPINGEEADDFERLFEARKAALPPGARIGKYAVASEALMRGVRDMLAEVEIEAGASR